MMAQKKNFEVAIIGSGIAGVTLAIALARRNVPVTIYEQTPEFKEIGAGVSFTPNAQQAMKICDPTVHAAFQKVATYNVWESKRTVWFDYIDGTEQVRGHQKPKFTITNSTGNVGVHRAHFLDEMVKHVPKGIARFGKQIKDIQEDQQSGKMVMTFADGTTAQADAVIGCDGIKSVVRRIILGPNHPSTPPVYSHKYAYRGMFPGSEAIKVLGEENAMNPCMHMGPGAHVLTFPVQHGEKVNLVAFKTTKEDWPDYQRLTRSATRNQALEDFKDFGPNVKALLNLCTENLDVWAIFDTGKHPLPTYRKGRICVSGDAAHATSPHHGAGAGFAIEDAAVLASILADESVQTPADLEVAFESYEVCRKERSQWLVQSSRRVSDLYEWQAEGIGKDLEKIAAEIQDRVSQVSNADVVQMCEDAKLDVRRRLGKQKL